jgi:TonB family protein
VAQPSVGALHVESQPPGATVTVNGEAKGQTPLEVAELALGLYEVKLELKGYEAKSQSVALTADTPRQEVKLQLTRAAPAMGVADIVSTPFGANVSIDGTRVGQTPVTEHKLRVGNRQVELTKDGYEPYTASLRVETGKRAQLDAQLKAILKPTPPATTLEGMDRSKIYNPGEVDQAPKKLSGTSPSYPDNAPKLRAGEEVAVLVSFVVTEDGDVTDIKIVESGGKLLDETVINAIRGFKYNPALKRGVKVKFRQGSKYRFKSG